MKISTHQSWRNSKAGLILAEALLSVAALTVGVVVLGSIMANATASTKVSRDYLLAQNLASEALEAAKNVRDTNWLRHPATPLCWLATGEFRISNCEASGIKAGDAAFDYIPVQDEDGVWDLDYQESNLDASDLDSDFVLYLENDRYVHGDSGTASNIYRSVVFSNETSADGIPTSIVVTVKVYWKDGAKTSKIDRQILLYNYL